MENIASASPAFLNRASDKALRLLGSDQRGTTVVLAALSLSILAGFAGVGVDVVKWETVKRQMQGTADMAAYSAALAASKGLAPRTTAGGVATQMGFADGQDNVTVAVNNPPTQGKYVSNSQAWEVIISEPQQLWFTGLYLSTPPIVSARAVGVAALSGSACVLALDSTASGAITVQGSTQVNLNGCNIQDNSSNNSALSVGGNAQLTADAVAVNGGYTVGSSATFSVGIIDAPGAAPIADPYANVNIPSYSGCNHNNLPNVNSATTLSPGVYCNGLTIGSAVVTLSPGVYIIDRGDFKIHSGAVVTGTGVTIILTSSTGTPNSYGSVTINGGSSVSLTAPTTGATAGLLFYQDRNAPSGAGNTLNGGSTQNLNGALYFPSTNVSYSGNGVTGACTQIVADTITFIGNSTVNYNCAGTGVTPIVGRTALAE